MRTADNLATLMCRLCGTSESLKLLEPYGPVQACTRIAFPGGGGGGGGGGGSSGGSGNV